MHKTQTRDAMATPPIEETTHFALHWTNAPETSPPMAPQHALALKAQIELAALPHMNIAAHYAELAQTQTWIQSIKAHYDQLLVLGTGGTINAILAITEGLIEHPHCQVHCVNTTDPHLFHKRLKRHQPDRTAVLIISKSGKTLETLHQAKALMQAWGYDQNTPKDHMALMSESSDNLISHWASTQGITTRLRHDPNLTGRFSALALPTLLPLSMSDVNLEALCAGASDALTAFLHNPLHNPATQSATHLYHLMQQGHSNHMMVYQNPKDKALLTWYRQIVGESLGKAGQGFNLNLCESPQDHHSQLQLWLDGPSDKCFTFFNPNTAQNPTIQTQQHSACLASNATLSDVNALLYTQAKGALSQQGKSLQNVLLTERTEKTWGSLMMHWMLETHLIAAYQSIDPTSQPMVDALKQRVAEHINLKAQ